MLKAHLVTADIKPLDIFNNFENYLKIIKKINDNGIIILPPLSFCGFNIESVKNGETFLNANLKTILDIKSANIKNLVIFSSVIKIKQKILNAWFFIKEGKILNVSIDKKNNGIINFDKLNIKSLELFNETVNISDNFHLENFNICMPYSKNIGEKSVVIYPLFKKELVEQDYYALQRFSVSKICAVLAIGDGYFDSSQNCVYSSDKIYIKNGNIASISTTFEKREILSADLGIDENPLPIKKPAGKKEKDFYVLDGEKAQKAFNILTYGVMARLKNTNTLNAVIGLSGGSDSVLSLMVLVNAFKTLKLDLKNIHAVTMPGFATSRRTFNNAKILIENLSITGENFDITNLVKIHLDDINNVGENIVYENAQARMRTLILMNLANKYNGIMIGTGDMSEMALGFCTFGGDQMSMYCANGGMPKTAVLSLIKFLATNSGNEKIKNCLLDVCATPISAELKKDVKSEDIVGDYSLNDYFLYKFATEKKPVKEIYSDACKTFNLEKSRILYWLKNFITRFFNNAYKRNCMPDCVQVFETFIYGGGFKICSDARPGIFLEELENI